jgi:outer membrane cobalamin receptor
MFKKTTVCFLLILLINPLFLFSQKVHLSFTIIDEATRPVTNATIYVNDVSKSHSDSSGKAIITIPSGTQAINILSLQHYPYPLYITADKDTGYMVQMKKIEGMLQNVTVTTSHNIVRNQMGSHTIGGAQLRKLPVLFGEVDPLKSITLLPGVKNGGEASAGLYVRGGGPDQNLVLLDGIPVYNPNHLLGMFSIFNGDAIKSVEVIKGSMPAEFGGRLSSVIAIETRESNYDSVKGSAGISPVAAHVSIEGPVIKGKSSFIVSARRSYIDQVAKIIGGSRIGGNSYYFYDINAKLNYIINPKNKLLFTLYTGEDKFQFESRNKEDINKNRIFKTNWGNTLAGILWQQRLTNRWSQNTRLIYNTFNLDSRFGFSTNSFAFSSGLKDMQAKSDWTYNGDKWFKFKTGIQYIWHCFAPGAKQLTAGVQEFKSEIKDQYAREAAVYAAAEIDITPDFNFIAGLRYSYFNQVGPTERIVYDDGVPTGEVVRFRPGESIAKYSYPEPRLNALYKLSNTSGIKASYTRTIQYLQLATTSGATFPSDLWLPSSKVIKPSNARQWAVGYFKNLAGNAWEVSVESYYKIMDNQIEFKPGTQLLLNQNLEGEMIFGSGKAYGLEMFVRKKLGKLTGWASYTLSRAERTFKELNNGKAFPYRYDRTHDFSIVGTYRLNEKWEASAVFVYGTGNALTMPTGRFTYNIGANSGTQPLFTNINQYDVVNNYRMPAYHRLDISFIYVPKPKSSRTKTSWIFGIYNVYNRSNPYFIYLDTDETAQKIKGRQVYLFPIVPSVTWNIQF